MKKIIALVASIAILTSCSVEKDVNKGETVQNSSENNRIEENTNNKKDTEESVGENNVDLYAINNTGAGWGFVKIPNKCPDIPSETTQMLEGYDSYYMDLNENKVLYLTFDEGYENGHTGQILDTLKKCNVPAAFFVTGSYFDREPELIERMIAEGHIVGNHTEHHPNLHKLENPERMQDELKILDDKYFEKFGEHMKYMRPPEGEYSERVLAAAKNAGYKTIFWSFAYKDWQKDVVRGADYAFNAVTPYLHSGAIILLHAVSEDNANALESIINYARDKGYEFKSLDEL